jgi:hypothetical protein
MQFIPPSVGTTEGHFNVIFSYAFVTAFVQNLFDPLTYRTICIKYGWLVFLVICAHLVAMHVLDLTLTFCVHIPTVTHCWSVFAFLISQGCTRSIYAPGSSTQASHVQGIFCACFMVRTGVENCMHDRL